MKPEAAPSCRRSRTDPMNWNLNQDLNLKEEEEPVAPLERDRKNNKPSHVFSMHRAKHTPWTQLAETTEKNDSSWRISIMRHIAL